MKRVQERDETRYRDLSCFEPGACLFLCLAGLCLGWFWGGIPGIVTMVLAGAVGFASFLLPFKTGLVIDHQKNLLSLRRHYLLRRSQVDHHLKQVRDILLEESRREHTSGSDGSTMTYSATYLSILIRLDDGSRLLIVDGLRPGPGGELADTLAADLDVPVFTPSGS